jgi:hypothetical protein
MTPMPDHEFDDLYGSKYMGAADLSGEVLRREIGKVELVELKDPKDGTAKRKYLAYYKGLDKPLPLNKTNANTLGVAYGKDKSKWVGVTVELYSQMTSLGKEGVRLRTLKAAGPNDMNDTITF